MFKIFAAIFRIGPFDFVSHRPTMPMPLAYLYKRSYIAATKACIDYRKKPVKQEYLPTCCHNMVNFGPLMAEIRSAVWGTPANFNEFRVLAALLHGTLVVGVIQTLRR